MAFSGVLNGSENVDLQTDFLAESLDPVAGLSCVQGGGEHLEAQSDFAAELLESTAARGHDDFHEIPMSLFLV